MMKYILFFLLFATVKAESQNTIPKKSNTKTIITVNDTLGNFYSSNLSVSWKHSFIKECSFQQLLNAIKRSNVLTNIDTFENTIVGQSVESFMDYRGAGYTAWNTPSYLSNSSFKSSVMIKYNEKGYTVTINRIVFINQNDTKLISPIFGSAQGEITQLEQIAIDREGKFRNGFIKSSAIIVDYTLNKLYDFLSNINQ